jgi:hypothetical protein
MTDLFGDRVEWEGMPEFNQPPQKPYAQIIIRVGSRDDLESLSQLLGQRLTTNTKSIWHPQLVRGINSNKRYISEE